MLEGYKTVWRERYRDPAAGRYARRLLITMTLYVALLVAVQRVVALDAMTGPLRWVLAALPGLPIAAVFWLIGRYIVELRDEYQRLLEVRKAMIATGVTMTVASIWGFLEMLADAAPLPAFYIPVIWFAALGVGQCANAVIERGRA